MFGWKMSFCAGIAPHSFITGQWRGPPPNGILLLRIFFARTEYVSIICSSHLITRNHLKNLFEKIHWRTYPSKSFFAISKIPRHSIVDYKPLTCMYLLMVFCSRGHEKWVLAYWTSRIMKGILPNASQTSRVFSRQGTVAGPVLDLAAVLLDLAAVLDRFSCFPLEFFGVTLPETNIFAPKNGWLEYYFHIAEAYFQVRVFNFQRTRKHIPPNGKE